RGRYDQDRGVGTHQRFTGAAGTTHAGGDRRDLRLRGTRSGGAVGGRTPDPVDDPGGAAGHGRMSGEIFVTPVHVRWSDIDMYQHVNHATMVTLLEEARIPFLTPVFGAEIITTGLLIADVRISYKG